MQYKTVEIAESKYNADFIKQIRVYMKETKVDKIVMSCPKNNLPWWIYIVGDSQEDRKHYEDFMDQIFFYLADDLPDLFSHNDESLPTVTYETDIRNVVNTWIKYVLTSDKLYEVI